MRTVSTCLAAGLVLTYFALPARAGEGSFIDELKIGVLAHDVPDLWSGFNREDGIDINAEVLFSPSFSFLYGTVRPAAGASINTAGGTSKFYLDARWQIGGETGFFLGTGLGVAFNNGERSLISDDRKALGSNVLFHIPLELGYRFEGGDSVSIYFEHMSNANTQSSNEGLDDLGIRYGRRF